MILSIEKTPSWVTCNVIENAIHLMSFCLVTSAWRSANGGGEWIAFFTIDRLKRSRINFKLEIYSSGWRKYHRYEYVYQWSSNSNKYHKWICIDLNNAYDGDAFILINKWWPNLGVGFSLNLYVLQGGIFCVGKILFMRLSLLGIYPQVPDEVFMLLARKGFGESVSWHLCSRDPFDMDSRFAWVSCRNQWWCISTWRSLVLNSGSSLSSRSTV